jgi:8-oxo-dGTP pyrophosphatase MutT (NUDIX family)
MTQPNTKILAPWRILNSEESFRTPWFVIRKYSCLTPLGDPKTAYYVHEAPDSVMCACITEEGFVVVERQYRLPLQSVSMDYPAGSVVAEDKNLEQAALRELCEETGFTAKNAEHIFSLSKDPSFSSGKIHVFLVTGACRINTSYDRNELVVVELLRPKEILRAVKTGEMSCAFCVATTLRLATLLNWKCLKE